ncbi:M36 family metallopeptidase [Kibdelosporangium philippinense]|uniref:M36 family metallopeptidase n=1 Tax=Kibdelosporangium philippinense TaxID=211113 RepID=UPI00360A7B45
MNESHSDLFAMEYLYEYGFKPRGDTPYVTGSYATGDLRTGIRNYDMSKSELNYSNIAYDLVGLQVHADGEIWSSTTSTSGRPWSTSTVSARPRCSGTAPTARCRSRSALATGAGCSWRSTRCCSTRPVR